MAIFDDQLGDGLKTAHRVMGNAHTYVPRGASEVAVTIILGPVRTEISEKKNNRGRVQMRKVWIDANPDSATYSGIASVAEDASFRIDEVLWSVVTVQEQAEKYLTVHLRTVGRKSTNAEDRYQKY